MKFGTAGVPRIIQGGTVNGIRGVADLGLDAMEIQFVRGVRMQGPMAMEARKVSQERGVLLSVHAPYYVNLLGSADVVKNSQQRILQSCRLASIIGASPVVVHAGYGRKTEEIIKAFKPILSGIADEELKTRIGLETMGRQKQWGSLEEVLQVCAELDVQPVLDFGHLHARSNGHLKTKGDYLEIFEKIKAVNPGLLKSLHCHFTCVDYQKGNEVRHQPIDQESPPFKPLAEVLLELSLEPTIISESPKLEVDAVKMKEMVNRMRS